MGPLIPPLPPADDTGFTAQCLTCGHEEPGWATRTEAQDAAVWHVYDSHRDTWRAVIGARAPMRPRPRKAA